MSHDDFKFEHQRGVPEPLPADEKLLWQGAPSWKALAIRAFHVRKIAVYFLLLSCWGLWDFVAPGATTSAGAVVSGIAQSLGLSLGLGAVCIGILIGLAWSYSRCTVYSITSKRLIIRSGIALQITVNVPFSIIQSAGMKRYIRSSTCGEIPVTLRDEHRVSYIVMWPNVRPWKLIQPQPMFRGLENIEDVAEILGAAMRDEQTTRMKQVSVSPPDLAEGRHSDVRDFARSMITPAQGTVG